MFQKSAIESKMWTDCNNKLSESHIFVDNILFAKVVLKVVIHQTKVRVLLFALKLIETIFRLNIKKNTFVKTPYFYHSNLERQLLKVAKYVQK